jgi:hypothetical protein
VRSAVISGDEVKLVGDTDKRTNLEVYVGNSRVQQISWNGKLVGTRQMEYGSLIAEIPGPGDRTPTLPTLTEWKTADSLPEIQPGYDDANWVICSKNSTENPNRPLTLPVLYSSDYGYHTGIKIYRGHFNGKSATRAYLTVQGGVASGWSAWLNQDYVGGSPGRASMATTQLSLKFPSAALLESGNVLTVVTDYHGHDQTSVRPSGPQNPRGILGATLYGQGNNELKFTQWKIQGNAGGAAVVVDEVRGPMNEGGLYGERLGWHLPGFDTSSWKAGSPTEGLDKAGVSWYITNFQLNIDPDLDVPLGLELSAPEGTTARVQIFING